MKLVPNLFLSLFALLALSTFDDRSYSLTNYQITQICKKKQRSSTCIKNLKEKKYNLEKGNLIEIPVVPYKK